MKKTIALTLAVLLIALCAAYALAESSNPMVMTEDGKVDIFQSTAYPAEGKTYKFAFIQNTGAHPYPQALVRFAQDECDKSGVELTVADAQMDPQKQVDLIKSFITQGYDAILNEPVDITSCLPAYQAAKEAGVVIIECAIPSDGATFELVNATVYGDAFEEGQKVAEGMMKFLPDGGNIVILEGALATPAQIGRTGGFLDIIKDKPEYVVLDQQTTDWMRDKAVIVMEDFLVKYPQIDFVYGHDDVITSGAFQAIEAAGREGILSGFVGASADGVQLIKEGKATLAVDQPPEYEARLSVQLAIRILNGETVEKVYTDKLGIVDTTNMDEFVPSY